jgi:hypothetical protein
VSATITRRIIFEVLGQSGGEPLTVPVRVSSTPEDADTVTLTFKHDGHDMVWEVPRDLLIDGIVTPTVIGDIQVAPDQIGWVAITIRSTAGTEFYRARRRTLTNFLADTADHVDITAELDEWLRGLAA